MPTYSVFGERLRSEITFPELRSAGPNGAGGREARWTLRVTRTPPASNHGEPLGTVPIMAGVDVRLFKLPNGYRLVYDDTGTFDITGTGDDIVWFQGPNSWIDAARLDIMNRVLPLSLHAAGLLCLHGSAVCLGDAAIAFLAPSYHGKSTLALAMAEAGARILTDDTVAVEPRPGSPVMARPGVHSVRLLDDAARALLGAAERLDAVGAYPLPRRDLKRLPPEQPVITKQVLRDLPAEQLMFDSVPLRTIYVLRPVRDTGSPEAVKRTRQPEVRAALLLVENTKSVGLLGKSEAPGLFDRAVTVARQVPVYLLEIVRDLGRLPDAARQLAQWSRDA